MYPSRRDVLSLLLTATLLGPAFLNGAFAAQSPKTVQIIAFGDSLMAGYGLDDQDSVPALLDAKLKRKGFHIKMTNAGVSGDTTSGGRARLDWVLTTADPQKPTLVILELGANDALRGLSPDLTRKNLDAMITTIRERGFEILLCGMMAPPNLGPDYAKDFNPIYADLAREHNVPLYPFFLEGVAAKATLNQQDGMHPNAQGTAIIANRLVPVIEPILKRMSREKAS